MNRRPTVKRTRPARNARLFGKPYTWRIDHNGTLTLRPAPKPVPLAEPGLPFTADLVRAAMRRLSTR